MSGVIKAASTDQYTECKLWTVADGLPKTDATFETSGLSIKWQINNAAIESATVAGSPAPATMSAGGAHADWGIYHVGNGWYKIGLADAVVETAGNRVRVWIELTDCDSAPAEIYVSGYDGALVAVGASTFDHTTDEVTTDEASRTASRADVSELASQSSVDTIDGVVDAIKLKTDNLPSDPADQSSVESAITSAQTAIIAQGNAAWITATGFSTHSAGDVLAALGTGTWATTIPWNPAWDAEVEVNVDDALRALDLDSALIAHGAQRAVSVDNSHRVHSHVYDMQANTLTASALAASAVAEIQDGLATSAALQVVDNNVDQIATDTTTLLGRVTSTVVTLWANLTAMITGSGLSAKFTTTALENAPGGGAGGEGDASQSTLLAVKQKTDLIGTTTFVAASFAPDSGNAIRIKVGDSPTITFTSSVENAVPDLTEATIRFGVRQHPSGEQLLTVNTGEVIVATGLQSVRVPLLVADTLLLQDASDCFEYRYDVEARYGDGSVRTMQSGAAMIEHDYSGV